MPRVMIALPVYNGDIFLEETLQDLANQSEQDMSVVVYDNCSTDRTNEIANRFAEKDKRFTVIRRPETVPLFDNFLLTLDDFDCEFFGWRAYDDLSAPNYVSKLADLLTEYPKAQLAGSQIRTHKMHKNRWKTHKAPPHGDFSLLSTLRVMMGSHASWIYGLFRRPSLDKWYRQALGSLPHTWAVDHATLLPMIVRGECVTTNDTYFIQRIGGDPAKSSMKPMPSAEQWAIYKAFLDYCRARVDETHNWSDFEKFVIKSAMVRYASKRTFRLSRMATAKLTGK